MKYPIVIRMDDIFPGMDEDRFLAYKTMFDRYQIKPLLGIIPDCQDSSIQTGHMPDFWRKMRELQSAGWPIAMHGCRHTYTTACRGLVCHRRLSEFAGLPQDEQYGLIVLGKSILQRNGIETDTFMAPGHSYDRNTLRALRNAGFRTVTDGRSRMPYILDGIQCIPAASAYRLHLSGLLTVCVHCCAETRRDFDRLEAFIQSRRDDIISFEQARALPCQPYWISRIEEVADMGCVDTISRLAGLLKK